MTYKKYIMRNGKMYGPYEYHSKRENGKVVSEYYGKHNKLNLNLNYNYIWWVFAGIILITLFYYAYDGFQENRSLTGNVIMDLSANYVENKSLDGKVRIELNQGEFIPASSKLIVETSSGENYEYSLKDLISENLSNGNFYIEGTQISGNGEGYGILGSKKSTEVYFTLEILKENKDDEKDVEEEETKTPSETPTSTETPTETKTENKTTEENITVINEENKTDVIINENKSNEEVEEVEEDVNKTEPTEVTTSETTTPTETKTEASETITPETSIPEVKEETKETTSTETTTTSESKSEVPTETTSTEKINEPSTETSTTTETTSETPTEVSTETTSTETNAEASAPITGGVIGARKGFLNFFKFFRLTGKVVDSSSSEVEGKVSKGSTFNYTLNSGETARIKSGSVRTVEKNLSENDISLKLNKNEVIVETDYSESETGFGEEYTGDGKKELIVDLNSLNISPEKGDLKIRVSYEGTDILSLTANLSEGNISATNEVISNESLNQTLNQTINQTVNLLELTEKEKQILIEHFGNISINTAKAEVFNGRLIVKYELENYWVEYSYDYNNNSLSNLNLKMEKDRTKWLKDLASMLSKESEKSEKEEVNELIQNYSI